MNSGMASAREGVAGTDAGPAWSILDRVACPRCRGHLCWKDGVLLCSCGVSYPNLDGIFDLRPPVDAQKPEEVDWSKHWSQANQQSLAQQFFSFYRKAVFARTVEHFVGRYFPPAGVFLEAGCGTAETSMRINKNGGARTLVALDLIRPVLEHCHPIMDVRICGDIFHLPFRENGLDGIWNVGVMEHFTDLQIDHIMREFRRALRQGARVVLLWPAIYSVPQKMLRAIEWIINLHRHGERFRFHPDEISQVRSLQHGREILLRNGFRPVKVDPGLRSLMAFEILVGEKPA
jgi:SAM-dependent methyltransferase